MISKSNIEILSIVFSIIFLNGCYISSIGGLRNASPVGKSVSTLSIRGVSNGAVHAGVLDYHYGYADNNDIGIQFIRGVAFEEYPVNGFGISIFHAFKNRKQFAYDVHGAVFTYNKLFGSKIMYGEKEYISYELNWTDLFDNEYLFTHHLFIGYSNPKGFGCEFGVVTTGLSLEFSPILGVGYNFNNK